ncbi:MAG: hypothetical protein IPL24_15410 [Bacteroidetes bacterium]|nr:hypothetical protein [Bacteroidota bacterium]
MDSIGGLKIHSSIAQDHRSCATTSTARSHRIKEPAQHCPQFGSNGFKKNEATFMAESPSLFISSNRVV